MHVLITGAGSGLGRALALHYARLSAQIAVTDQHLGAAQETLALVQREGGSGLAIALDVTQEADFAQVADQLRAAWGGLDLLINNAGVAVAGSVAETTLGDWQWLLNINVLGVVRGTRALLPLLRAKKGHVVNIASMAGIANPPGMSAYNVSKAGVIAFSETLRGEVAADGIGVTVVCPAFFPTNLMNNARVAKPETVGLVHKFMKKSGVTADDVARQIAGAVQRKQFMLLTHKDTRMQWLIKRASPEKFFQLVLKSTQRWR